MISGYRCGFEEQKKKNNDNVASFFNIHHKTGIERWRMCGKKGFQCKYKLSAAIQLTFFFFYVLKWDMHNNLVLHTAAPIIVMLTVQIYRGWDTQSQPLAAQARCPPHREGDDGEQTANN